MSANVCIIIAIVVYLGAMLYVGFAFSKNNNNAEDFYLGGRKMGPFVTAMSAEASDMSSWLLMGLPGVAYLSGICSAAWTAIGLGIGTWLNWFFVSRRLRRYSSNIGAITVPDFFSKRYHDNKNIINAIAALVIIIFFVPYTASGFAACGKLFHTLFGVDYMAAMIVSALVRLYHHGRFRCSLHDRPYPEYRNVTCTCNSRYIWYQFSRWICGSYGQCKVTSGLSFIK